MLQGKLRHYFSKNSVKYLMLHPCVSCRLGQNTWWLLFLKLLLLFLLLLQILFACYHGNLRLTSHDNKAFYFVSTANRSSVRLDI